MNARRGKERRGDGGGTEGTTNGRRSSAERSAQYHSSAMLTSGHSLSLFFLPFLLLLPLSSSFPLDTLAPIQTQAREPDMVDRPPTRVPSFGSDAPDILGVLEPDLSSPTEGTSEGSVYIRLFWGRRHRWKGSSKLDLGLVSSSGWITSWARLARSRGFGWGVYIAG